MDDTVEKAARFHVKHTLNYIHSNLWLSLSLSHSFKLSLSLSLSLSNSHSLSLSHTNSLSPHTHLFNVVQTLLVSLKTDDDRIWYNLLGK